MCTVGWGLTELQSLNFIMLHSVSGTRTLPKLGLYAMWILWIWQICLPISMIRVITMVSEAKKLQPFVGQAAVVILAEPNVLELSLALFFTLPFSFLFCPYSCLSFQPHSHPFLLNSDSSHPLGLFPNTVLTASPIPSFSFPPNLQIQPENLAPGFQYPYFAFVSKVLPLHNK